MTAEEQHSITNIVNNFIDTITSPVYMSPADKRAHLVQCALACGQTTSWVLQYAKELVVRGHRCAWQKKAVH